jgi:hypothetical protein
MAGIFHLHQTFVRAAMKVEEVEPSTPWRFFPAPTICDNVLLSHIGWALVARDLPERLQDAKV